MFEFALASSELENNVLCPVGTSALPLPPTTTKFTAPPSPTLTLSANVDKSYQMYDSTNDMMARAFGDCPTISLDPELFDDYSIASLDSETSSDCSSMSIDPEIYCGSMDMSIYPDTYCGSMDMSID
jgi:hypothetical protein